MSTFTISPNSGSALTAPQAGADPMAGLRMQAGIFGLVDGIIDMLTGFSPLKEWVFKPLAGDWTALDKGAEAWTNAGKAAVILADNVDTLPGKVQDGWAGAGEQQWEKLNKILSDALRKMAEQSTSMSTACAAISVAAQAIASLIADLLGQLSELAIRAMVQAAIPVVGWAAEAETAAELGVKITVFGGKIAKQLEKFSALIAKLAPILEKLFGIGAEVMQVANKLASYAPKVVKLANGVAKVVEGAEDAYQLYKKAERVKNIAEKVQTGVEYAQKGVDVATKAADATRKTEATL